MHSRRNEAGGASWSWIPGVIVVTAIAVLVAIDGQAGSGFVDDDELGGGIDPPPVDDLDEASPTATLTMGATSTPTLTPTFTPMLTPTSTPTPTPTAGCVPMGGPCLLTNPGACCSQACLSLSGGNEGTCL